ncbi:MAG: PAC2 family protein [Actinobacteria bacterium]|nr:PAC2 family protein [Actinomycetota bacterium]NDD86180.1 PAC2 family protein [Actinomycetota bacterium]
MNHSEVMEADWEAVGPLRDPVLVIALRGWFDVAGVATGALEWCIQERSVTVVASIDPDPFFDFTQERPETFIDEDGDRHIRWPENDFLVVRFPEGARDLVLMSGVEPHLHWTTFADCIVEAAQQLKCGVVVTVGAAAEGVPHTRSPQVFGSTTNGALARRLGLSRPQYQGPTGVVGVIQERLDREGLTGVSLRVGVPHYLSNAQHPKSSAALLRHLEHVLGVPTSHGMMYEEIQRWEELHDAAVDGDQQTEHYVKMLEEEYDRRTEASVPTGDDLAAEFERFLREENGNDEPGEN